MLIKHKKIFECFSCFWKIFCFCKNCQIFKTFDLTCFGGLNWRLTSVVKIAWFAKGRSFSNTVLKKGLNLLFLHPVVVHFLVSLSIFQHHRGKLQILPLFCQLFLNLQGKVWVLFSTLPFSELLPFPHGFCAFYDICISLDCVWIFDCLVSSLCVFRILFSDLLYIVTTLGNYCLSLSFSGHFHLGLRVFFIIHTFKLTHC